MTEDLTATGLTPTLDNIPIIGMLVFQKTMRSALENTQEAPWIVIFTGKSRKQKIKLPPAISATLDLLYGELEHEGPDRANWPHYGKITGKPDMRHCHLNKGSPRYVAVWKVTDKTVKVMEIRYVGTHENANYRRID